MNPLSDNKRKELREEMLLNQMWHNIRTEAKTNPALQEALDHVILIYKLGKENKDGI